MFNSNFYKTPNKHSISSFYRGVSHVLIILITAILITTGIRTINLIFTLKHEQEVKKEVMIHSYIDLVKSKNEAQTFASPQSIMHQARDIFSIQKSNELRVVILNQHEIDRRYQIILTNIKNATIPDVSNTPINQWQIWWDVLWNGVY